MPTCMKRQFVKKLSPWGPSHKGKNVQSHFKHGEHVHIKKIWVHNLGCYYMASLKI
jgi:hypothetical protein